MQIPENNAERLAAINAAGAALASAMFPSAGYNPRAIGTAFADALMSADMPIELDLSNECLSLILSAAQSRLAEHYDMIQAESSLSAAASKIPSPSYPSA
jgi:hypothetical protein